MTLHGPFRFDATTHTYTVGTRVVPAVSTIVRWAHGQSSGPWMKPDHRERGQAVHEATLALDLGTATAEQLDASLRAQHRPYFRAYVAFRETVVFQWAELEQPRVNRDLAFAGTPDRLGYLNGYPALLELKTGYLAPWHGIQTAGQDILAHQHFGQVRRYVVYLQKNGRFKLREHTDAGDYLKFLAALQRYHEAAQMPSDAFWAPDDTCAASDHELASTGRLGAPKGDF